MEKFSPDKKYIPFTYKMMIPYLVLVLLTDLLVGYIAYTMLVESRTEMAETNVRTALKQTRSNIEYQTDEIKRMSNSLFLNTNFQNALQFRGSPLENMLKMRDDIVPYMKAPLQLYGNKLRLALYTANERMLEITGDDMAEPIGRSDYYVLSGRVIEDKEWFRSIVMNNRDSLWLQADSDSKLGNISYFRKLVASNAAPSIIGYIRVTARIDELFGSFDTFPVDQGLELRLVDRAQGLTIYEQGAPDKPAKPDQYLIISEDIPIPGYVIEARVPHSYLNKDASRMQKAIGAVCTISFVVMAAIGFLVARISGKKIKRIVYLARSFQEGNFYKRIGFPGNDEFVYIANSFNQMAASIQELIRNVYVQGLQKKQAELDVLQAQISPHFLYNTLSTIGSLANLGEVGKVTRMVKGLSKFYRLTLNEGRVYISIEKELEQVKMYLDIQRVKYADAFEVYYDIDPEILQVPVIKLILQPFVENIFKHAWFGESIAIRITGRRLGDRIELKVIDNGIGMRPDTLRSMRAGSFQPGSYGLKNVEERIKLRYGNDYGIQIGSYYGAGTAVQIVLPVENAEIREVRGE
ncbi:sensor histidine kinase [Paenibacillus typhae]|uniref:Histidine kinase-, DNA gyrase B-, and HSP90-like ATPase n=1 Tax=Paenibacillus typhae TaxID=1174501 RepID=A0A1G8ZN56_9BACL|nr:histidine kinase [Paenibacillus typhae]MBY0009155.1 histidine kinase [Paenibacillus typhae]SDK15590.1 Histidine kinase-, DNA gyrase B-, and HSP90-like ATPase [Paenibacillus typhae]